MNTYHVKFTYKDGWTRLSPEVSYKEAKEWFEDKVLRFGVKKLEMIETVNNVVVYSLDV